MVWSRLGTRPLRQGTLSQSARNRRQQVDRTRQHEWQLQTQDQHSVQCCQEQRPGLPAFGYPEYAQRRQKDFHDRHRINGHFRQPQEQFRHGCRNILLCRQTDRGNFVSGFQKLVSGQEHGLGWRQLGQNLIHKDLQAYRLKRDHQELRHPAERIYRKQGDRLLRKVIRLCGQQVIIEGLRQFFI